MRKDEILLTRPNSVLKFATELAQPESIRSSSAQNLTTFYHSTLLGSLKKPKESFQWQKRFNAMDVPTPLESHSSTSISLTYSCYLSSDPYIREDLLVIDKKISLGYVYTVKMRC